MVNKCGALKCTPSYTSNEIKEIAKFQFLSKKSELNKQWICFVNKND